MPRADGLGRGIRRFAASAYQPSGAAARGRDRARRRAPRARRAATAPIETTSPPSGEATSRGAGRSSRRRQRTRGRRRGRLGAFRDGARDDDERESNRLPNTPAIVAERAARRGRRSGGRRRRPHAASASTAGRRARRTRSAQQAESAATSPVSMASRAHSAARKPRPHGAADAGMWSKTTISPTPPCAPRSSRPSTTTPAPRRSPASSDDVVAHPTAAPDAPSATAASDASFSTRTIGAHAAKSSAKSGFIRRQNPSRMRRRGARGVHRRGNADAERERHRRASAPAARARRRRRPRPRRPAFVGRVVRRGRGRRACGRGSRRADRRPSSDVRPAGIDADDDAPHPLAVRTAARAGPSGSRRRHGRWAARAGCRARRARRCTSIVVERVSPTAAIASLAVKTPASHAKASTPRGWRGARRSARCGDRSDTGIDLSARYCIMAHNELIRTSKSTLRTNLITDDGSRRGQRRACDSIHETTTRGSRRSCALGAHRLALAGVRAPTAGRRSGSPSPSPRRSPTCGSSSQEYNSSQDEVDRRARHLRRRRVLGGLRPGRSARHRAEQLQPGDGALHPALRHVGPVRHGGGAERPGRPDPVHGSVRRLPRPHERDSVLDHGRRGDLQQGDLRAERSRGAHHLGRAHRGMRDARGSGGHAVLRDLRRQLDDRAGLVRLHRGRHARHGRVLRRSSPRRA